jgi:hypothetical protein
MVRRLIAASTRRDLSRVVSRTLPARVAVVAGSVRPRVSHLHMIYHMTVLFVYDSHRLQISNELGEVLLEARFVYL